MSRFDGPAFEAMVEQAAKALHAVDGVAPWDSLTEPEREFSMVRARAGLVAALEATETRDEHALPGDEHATPPSWLWLRWADQAGLIAGLRYDDDLRAWYRIVPA